jgi:predicted NAD/FAD-dependent oxidoreductase
VSESPKARTCLIVGAGISGLLAANALQREGWKVTVLDKGRGVGGRMATRRFGGGNFDHGAQFFTVRGDRFSDLLQGWVDAGAAAEWSRGFADADGKPNEDGHPRYRGTRGMTSIPKYLARGLDVRTGERAVSVNARAGGWEVACESGPRFEASALLLAMPVPQALELATSGDYGLPAGARQKLEAISYGPCLALMVLLDGPADVPGPGGMQIKGEPLDWIGDNQRKGISDLPAITIHAGPEWSSAHLDDDEADITRQLVSFASDQLGTDLSTRIIESSLARWRYSWVTNAHPEPFLAASEDPSLIFCGDAFGQPKVEGAALSGLAAADYLLG